MKKNPNSPERWDQLLTADEYLEDEGPMTLDRIKTAKRWRFNRGRSRLILNVGSGQGFLENQFFYLIRQKNVVFYSLDISLKGLERIKKLFNTNTVLGSIIGMPIKSGMFDTIYCMEVLEHIKQKDAVQAYKELNRVAKSGGELIISVPVYEARSLKDHPVGHVKKYTPSKIEKEINTNGFYITHKKELFAFPNLYLVKTLIAKKILKRRWKPNVVIYRCTVKK